MAQSDFFEKVDGDWRDLVDYSPATGRVWSPVLDVRVNKSGEYLKIYFGSRAMEFVQVFAAKKMGAYFDGCDVHHVNEDKLDNRWCNLEVMTRKAHVAEHKRREALEREAVYRRWPLKDCCPGRFFEAYRNQHMGFEAELVENYRDRFDQIQWWIDNVAVRRPRDEVLQDVLF